FSAMLRRCRWAATEDSLPWGMTATCWEVSISPPSGHLSEVSTSTRMALIYGDVQTAIGVRLLRDQHRLCKFAHDRQWYTSPVCIPSRPFSAAPEMEHVSDLGFRK